MRTLIKKADPTDSAASTRLLTGARHLLWGLKTSLSHGSLLLLSVAVVAVNLLVYCLLLGIGIYYSGDLSRYLAEKLPDAIESRWLEISLQIVVIGAWAMVSLFLAIGAASALTGPLLDRISERTERILTGDVHPPPFSIQGFVMETAATLAIMLRSLLVGIVATVLLGWIPVVGQAIPFLVAAAFVALNFIQPTAARHRVTTRDRIRMLTQNKALILGFGLPASIFPFLLVPILTPALVVGGTRLYLSLAAIERVPNTLTEAQRSALAKP